MVDSLENGLDLEDAIRKAEIRKSLCIRNKEESAEYLKNEVKEVGLISHIHARTKLAMAEKMEIVFEEIIAILAD